MNEEAIAAIIKTFASDRRFIVSEAFADGGEGPLLPRLLRAAVDQSCGDSSASARYGIWSNTVRDRIRQASVNIEAGDVLEAHRLLYEAANSLSAFAELQAAFLDESEAKERDIVCAAPLEAFASSLKPDWLARVRALQDGFPVAAAFLKAVGEGRYPGFWLSTAVNGHLYYRQGFYVYIKPERFEVELRSTFHSHIAEGTEDCSHQLFGSAMRSVLGSVGGPANWAREISDGYVVKNSCPAEFFDELLARIQALYEAGK